MDEYQIQFAVCQLLRLKKIFFYSIPNERASSARNMNKMKMIGLKPGIPDLCIIYKSKHYYLELKKEKGTKSSSQIKTQKQLIENGQIVETAYGLNHAIAILKKWGIL